MDIAHSFSQIAITLILTVASPLFSATSCQIFFTTATQAQNNPITETDRNPWQELTSTEGNFIILMPGKPTEVIEPVKYNSICLDK